jgi:hypothetical protein
LPVYSRAELSRTGAIVVAPFLTANSTSAAAREFRAADTRSEGYPTVQASPEALVISHKAWQSLSAEDRRIFCDAALLPDRKPFEAATAGIHATTTQRDAAAAQLIERIRKVE